ncbi:MAG: hypothetical protein AMXMBFR25_03990 [Lysobacterales bacterium]
MIGCSWKAAVPPATLALMRAIEAQFDPHGTLDPGKVLTR